jgi:hypothetical protein
LICFSDTDIILKLIAFGLLEQALAALGVTSKQEVYVTPEAASKCRRSKYYRTDFRQQVLNEALEFLKHVTIINDPGDPDELNQLRDIEEEGIDAGETTLFLATKGVADFILITGDKRALRTLTNNFLSAELHNRHIGRICCLETILLRVIQTVGFAAVHHKLLGGQQCDIAIKNALRDGNATEAEFTAELERLVNRLDFETQGLLMKWEGR